MQKVSEFLIEAKKVIEDPTRWTTEAYAKDENGNTIDPCHENASCFCSLGALESLCRTPDIGVTDLWYNARSTLDTVMQRDVAGYNDNHTHEEVMQKWDEAINLAKAQESK